NRLAGQVDHGDVAVAVAPERLQAHPVVRIAANVEDSAGAVCRYDFVDDRKEAKQPSLSEAIAIDGVFARREGKRHCHCHVLVLRWRISDGEPRASPGTRAGFWATRRDTGATGVLAREPGDRPIPDLG